MNVIKSNCILLSLMLCATLAFAQQSTDTLRIHARPYAIYKGNVKLKPAQWVSATSSNRQAQEYMHKAKGNYDAAGILGFTGGFLLGWPIGQALSGKEPAWAMAGAGFGLALLTIPLSSSCKKNTALGVQTFNASVKSMGMHPVDIEFGITENGTGFNMKF